MSTKVLYLIYLECDYVEATNLISPPFKDLEQPNSGISIQSRILRSRRRWQEKLCDFKIGNLIIFVAGKTSIPSL